MIYDCFCFFNENDLLDLRLNYLNEVVDKFIIVEASKTHSGDVKPKFFDEKRFEKFKNKIIYVLLEDLPEHAGSWFYENYQRNYVHEVLKSENAKNDDIIIVSDLDEIPSVEAIIQYKTNPDGIKAFEQRFYNFYFNLLNETETPWTKAKIFQYKEFETVLPQERLYYDMCLVPECNASMTATRIRMAHSFNTLKNGGWHISFLGGAEAIKYKIESFAHQEFNKDCFTDLDHIKDCLVLNKDVLRRDNKYRRVELTTEEFPLYLVENKEKFKKYILD